MVYYAMRRKKRQTTAVLLVACFLFYAASPLVCLGAEGGPDRGSRWVELAAGPGLFEAFFSEALSEKTDQNAAAPFLSLVKKKKALTRSRSCPAPAAPECCSEDTVAVRPPSRQSTGVLSPAAFLKPGEGILFARSGLSPPSL